MTNQPTESPAEIAERLVEELFTNGMGQKAQRLVLELENGKDGGGWGKAPVRDRIATALQAEREANTVDLCENCDGTTEVTNELSGFATVAFCIKCWNKRESEIAAKLQAEREQALEAASQAIADHIFTLPDGSLPWGLDSGIDVKAQLIRAVNRALAQKGGG